MIRLFRQRLIIAKFTLIVLTNTWLLSVSHILGLKTEQKCLLVNQIPVAKISGKTATWTIFSFTISPPNYINCECMLLMQQSHVQWCIQWNLLFSAHNLVLLKKNLKNKDFSSLTQMFKLLVWVPKIIRTCIIVA